MIIYLAYISIGFVIFQFLNVLLNLIFSQKIHKITTCLNKCVSILIPVRNEEDNIGYLLNDLKKIKSTNIEILVFDDQSTDNTISVVNKYISEDDRIKLIRSNGLPDHWLGKNYACCQLAQKAKGDYYLFVDADVRLQGNIIEDSINFIEKYKLGLLSVFPVQIQKTIGEKLTVPIMNYILLTLLPLILVRISPFVSHSAANGQFMFFDAEIYKKTQPHKLFKTSPVEDISIAQYFKKSKINIACLTGEKRIKCRMYKNYSDARNGFTKNVFMFFGNKPLLAFIFWIFAFGGFIPVFALSISWLVFYFVTVLFIQFSYSIISKQNAGLNILFFLAQMIFMFQVMIKNSLIIKNKNYIWKGRNIYS